MLDFGVYELIATCPNPSPLATKRLVPPASGAVTKLVIPSAAVAKLLFIFPTLSVFVIDLFSDVPSV